MTETGRLRVGSGLVVLKYGRKRKRDAPDNRSLPPLMTPDPQKRAGQAISTTAKKCVTVSVGRLRRKQERPLLWSSISAPYDLEWGESCLGTMRPNLTMDLGTGGTYESA
jgi:hypothetical protein